MPDEFTTSAFIPAMPMAVYMAWLDSAKHGEMTGADAHCEAKPGAPYDAWDGYIQGTTVQLEPGRRIVQRWRTAEFPGDAPDSTIELTLAPEGNGTRLKIKHTGIPEGQGKLYESGWQDHYFRPMQEYFIHAGISGVPAGASLTEILHRVSTGQATPSSPSLPVFREQTPPDGKLGIHESDEVADAREPVEVIEDHSGVSSGDFELADDSDDDDFDTSKPAQEQTGSEDFWKHLEAPPRESPALAPVVDAERTTPGRRPARRAPVGAGKPKQGSGRRAGLKPAARPNKKPLAAKTAKPKKKAGGKKKPTKKKAPPKKQKPAKRANKSPKRQRGSVKKPKKPAPKKKAAKKKPSKKPKPTKKKPAANKKKPKGKKKR
jgi:uncharacterized protein YndB with AHSA1/START domain